ncbi:MAG: hypothetical protein IT212_07470 [Bacteroidia bacterium]|nr:hypothetical protein [Bacteroidia bacterium]
MSKGNKFTEADIVRLQGKGLSVNDPVIDTKLKKAFGLSTKKNYSNKEKDHLEWVLKGMKLEYKKEFKFNEFRKFRFDFCIPDKMIAIEYEGIYSDKSRHTTVGGFANDIIKYNIATVNGWRVLRYCADNYMNIVIDLETLINHG